MILEQGEDASEIYFIISGELKVFFEYEHEGTKYEVSRFFNKGYYFGDYGVFTDEVSSYNYVASTKLKMIILPKFIFLNLIDEYPEIKLAMITTTKKYRKQMHITMVHHSLLLTFISHPFHSKGL